MRIGSRPLAIDTNVILRYILRDDEVLSAKAKVIFDAVETGRITVLCHPVILAEVVWVLESHYKTPPEKIVENVQPILEADCFIISDKDVWLRALRLFAGPVPHFGDACVCAAAMEECEGKLLSFDRKLSAVKGITRSESV
ncbi:MAG: PIN domain-containing protein [Armatimonadota bacterium]|nr:PIN domain-containing protein [Armatimonadota bacterium]